METFQFNADETDVFFYIGSIDRDGYSKLSNEIANLPNRKHKALICMTTFGGDPDAGYRIGRCLQHYYPKQVAFFIPSLCKSSGTLAAIAANSLIIGNQGELGPLDIQLRKTDEIGEQSSGLDIFKAIDFLEDRASKQFVQYLRDIRFGSGVSTRLSADIAAKLVESIIQPIASQIDPFKIGEHQRAVGIAQKYGELLNEMTKSLKEDSLGMLISGYPSHSFVIDRKEAEKLFNNVFKPCNRLTDFLKEFLPYCFHFNIIGSKQFISYISLDENGENSPVNSSSKETNFEPTGDDSIQTEEIPHEDSATDSASEQPNSDTSDSNSSDTGKSKSSTRTKSSKGRVQQKGA